MGVAPDPERFRRRAERARVGAGVVVATSCVARKRGELDDEAVLRAGRSDEWRGVANEEDGDGASRYGESWGV